MELLVISKTSNKPIEVTDKSDVELAVKNKFKNEIRNRPFKIQYYSEKFKDYVDLEYADIENNGKLRLIVEDCMDMGKISCHIIINLFVIEWLFCSFGRTKLFRWNTCKISRNSEKTLSDIRHDMEDDKTSGLWSYQLSYKL